MSVFVKTTQKVQRPKQYKKKRPISSSASRPFHRAVQICPNLDENGAMAAECEPEEYLQCQLCLKSGNFARRTCFASRVAMRRHILKEHPPNCPNCKIAFKTWERVSEHQPFCYSRAQHETRSASIRIFSLVKKMRLLGDWSVGETDSDLSGFSDSESWMSYPIYYE